MADGFSGKDRITLVTGGSGFVGAHLAKRLAAAGRAVRTFSRTPGPHADGIETRCGDIRSKDAVREAMRGVGTVFHAAALIPGCGSDREIRETNVEGTRNIVEACLAGGAERLVLISSISVYASPLPSVIAETAPVGGVDAYGASKAAAEALVREGCAGRLKHIILRPCQVFGPADGTHYTGRMLRMLSLPALPLPGGSSRSYSLLHLDDLLDALLLAESKAELRSEAYNIAAASPTTLMEMAGWAAEASANGSGIGRRPFGIPVPDSGLRLALSLRWFLKHLAGGAKAPLWRSYFSGKTDGSLLLGGPVYDISKARRELGYHPGKSFSKALWELLGRDSAQGG